MKLDSAKQLDEAVAVMLADLNSANILRCARQARQVAILLAMDDDESRRVLEGLTADLSRLYRSVLVLERDPEVIRRNTLAAVLMSLYMANGHSSGDWQFEQSVAMALPTVILKAGWLKCGAARFLPGRVAG
jgi:hypothetical protein